MHMQFRKITTFLALLLGVIIAIFGVFFFNFGDFLSYDGRQLGDIFLEIRNNWDVGLYEFTWMSFRFNIFNFFFALPHIDLVGHFLPVFLTWFISGLVTGLLVIGVKRGILFSFIITALLVILWLCFAVISGANLTVIFFQNLYETGGGILTALISVLLGGSIGGAISGAISIKMENNQIIKEVTSK